MEQYLEYTLAICAQASLMFLVMGIMLRNINKKLDKLQNHSSDLKTEMKKRDERIDHLYEICIGMVNHTPRR
jgi:hypothetical protein